MRVTARGRPAPQPNCDDRQALFAAFLLMGRIGLPTLRNLFPSLSRGTLIEYQRRCFRILRRHGRRWIHALLWHRPGAVWAADFAEPPGAVDGLYRWILHVRDLASGKQLLSLPILRPTAETAIAALESLAKHLGAPLVLKLDNGAAFIAADLHAWAERHGTRLLFSPPRTPSYNGAIEAGIGSIHTRAHHEAARHDRPGEWTCDDVEAARRQANATARPRGVHGPTPDEAWAEREPLTASDRASFDAAYRVHAVREREQREISPFTRLQRQEQASIDRVAISRALMDTGFLSFRRRRISPPIRRQLEQEIS